MATETFTCEICHNTTQANNKQYINCGHAFCKNCIEEISPKNCPICGKGFDEFGCNPPGHQICPICQDVIGGTKGFLLCGHPFCLACLDEWNRKWGNCPVCKFMSSEIITQPPTPNGPIGPIESIGTIGPIESIGTMGPIETEEEKTPNTPPRLLSLDCDLPGKGKKGSFSCECGKKWKSEYSHENAGQKCAKCKRSVTPVGLKPGKRTGKTVKFSAHKVQLCGRCQELDGDCSQSKFTKEDLDKFCLAMRNSNL